jgi:predicted sugar kinase
VRERLVPAVVMNDFPMFASSLYHYGRMSGEIFAARQGGPYNGPVIAGLIEQIRGLGCEGVGQSSWGPTVFVAVPSETDAESLVKDLERHYGKDLVLMIAAPANQGAIIKATGIPSVEQALAD